MARGLTRFEWGCVGVLVAAALVRIGFILEPSFIWDSAWFLMLARSFGDTGTFLIRWSEPGAPMYSGYWPPLFPIFAAPFVKVFGPTYQTLVLAASVASALLVAGVFLTTRDLFDRPRAFAAAAIVAATPAFYVTDANGMSESLLGLMVVLTLWAFLRSLTQPVFLPLAGVFAFLAYLGKASLGLPFVAVGILALAGWRVYTRGWRNVVRSPVDVGVAVAGLVGIAALALTRTERIGGLGLGLIEPLRRGFLGADCGIGAPGPHCWLLAFPLKIVFVCAFLFVITLPLSLRLPQLLKAPRTERTDAMWLAVILPIVAGAVFTTTFFYTEKRKFVDFDNIRYLTPAIVPFVWLLLPLWRFDDEPDAKDDRVRRRHLAWYWSAVAAMALVLLLNPIPGSQTLGRFVLASVLALVPVALSLAARATQYGIAERRVQGTTEHRFVRERQPAEGRRMVALAAVVLIVGGWFYSSWYALLGFGVLVVLATPSVPRRLVAISIVLLVSASPSVFTAIPTDEMVRATQGLPEGTVVGMSEIAVYPAAVAPDGLEVRLVDPEAPIPDEVDVLVMQAGFGTREYADFTRVAAWDYEFRFFPSIALRVWIEENLLGSPIEYQRLPGLAVYVRDGSGLEQHIA